MSFGALLASGHDLDHLLDTYSLRQIGAMRAAVIKHEAFKLNMVMAPIAEAFEVGWKGPGVETEDTGRPRRRSKPSRSRRRRPPRRSSRSSGGRTREFNLADAKHQDPAKAEAGLRAAFGRAGFRFRQTKG